MALRRAYVSKDGYHSRQYRHVNGPYLVRKCRVRVSFARSRVVFSHNSYGVRPMRVPTFVGSHDLQQIRMLQLSIARRSTSGSSRAIVRVRSQRGGPIPRLVVRSPTFVRVRRAKVPRRFIAMVP